MMPGAPQVDLTGRVACVTGASSGLGRRAALVLARAGAQVVAVARRAEALDGLAAEFAQTAVPSPMGTGAAGTASTKPPSADNPASERADPARSGADAAHLAGSTASDARDGAGTQAPGMMLSALEASGARSGAPGPRASGAEASGAQGSGALASEGLVPGALAPGARASEGRAGGAIAALPWDLTDRDGLAELARQAALPFGPPDIVVHAAGINTREPASEVTPAGWDITLALNLSVPFFLTQHLVRAMQAQGWGRIVTFGSLQSHRAFPGGIAYGASKGGVAQMTRAMAEAWSPHGITANALGPGFFRTELTAAVFDDPERAARNAAQTCLGRNGEVEDMDGPLLFFCSDMSAYVTGQMLMVDGGFTAK